MRPEEICGGDVDMNIVLLNVVAQVPADVYVQTHSTNPLLRTETVTRAIDAYLANRDAHDSLFTVTALQTRLYTESGDAINHDPAVLLRTQDLPPVLEENSCLYVFTAETHPAPAQAHRRASAAVRDRPRRGLGHRRGDRLEGRRGAVRGGARMSAAGGRVLITCRQMQNCYEEFRPAFEARALDVELPPIVQQPTEDELIALIGDFDGMIAGDDPLTARVLEHARRMRIISKWGVGTDGIDKQAARARRDPGHEHARGLR